MLAITQTAAGTAGASPHPGRDPSPHGRCTLRRAPLWEISLDQSARPLKPLLHPIEHPLRRLNEFVDRHVPILPGELRLKALALGKPKLVRTSGQKLID